MNKIPEVQYSTKTFDKIHNTTKLNTTSHCLDPNNCNMTGYKMGTYLTVCNILEGYWAFNMMI